MADYQRPGNGSMFRFLCRGMSMRPVDQLQPDEYEYLQNIRVTEQGCLESRLGAANASRNFTDPVHSIRRLVDPTPNAAWPWRWIIGAGTKLYTDASSTPIDTGYSASPLSMIVWRPDQSVSPWMYIADSSKMSKVRVDGTVKPWGLPQPSSSGPIPVIAVGTAAQFGRQMHELVSENGPATQWTAGGTATTPSGDNRIAVEQMPVVLPYPLGQSSPPYGVWSAVLQSASSGGVIQSITVTSGGGGYTSNFSVTISGGGGSGAIANAVVDTYHHTVVSVTLLNGGSGYTSAPTIGLTGGGGSGASATAYVSSPSGGIPSYGYTGIQPGSLLSIGTGASSPGTHLCDVTVEQVFSGAPPTTIAAIHYDSGGTLGCTIVPAALPAQMAGNSSSFANPDLSVNDNGVAPGTIMVLNAGGGNQEYLVVGTVINGPDGTAAIRAYTTLTHAAGESIQFFPTLVFSSDTYQVPGTNTWASAPCAKTQITAGTGTLSNGSVSVLTPQGPNGYGWKQEDYVAVTLWVDDPTQVVDLTLTFDVDITGNRDFAHNAYYYTFTSQPQIDPVNAGQGQWQTYMWRLTDMLRIGTDDGSTLQTIYGTRLTVDSIGTVNVKIDSVCLIGGGAIDVGTAVNDYYYRYRWRNLDGSYSNWSPPSRSGLHLRRNAAIVPLPTGMPYDKADIARFGGALTAWTYVGTTDASQGWQFVDNFSDEAIAANPQAQLDDYQAFPDIDVPHSGTCNTVGQIVMWVSGDQFDMSWAPGSEILINETVYHLFLSPDSPTVMRIAENAGAQNGVRFLLTGPTRMAQTLPSVWGPDDQGVMFGCGSSYQPGVVFFTNGNAPDNASDKNEIEVSSPGDPMIGGVLNAGRAICCSTTRWWALYPALQGPSRYGPPVELQVGKPLLCRTGICSDGQTIAFISDDGIYITNGAQAQSITDPDLRELFPHPASTGSVTTPTGQTIYQPDWTKPDKLRLAMYDRMLYFDYLDTQGNYQNFVYDFRTGGWVSRDTFPTFQVLMHYGVDDGPGLVYNLVKVLMGCSDGNLRWYSTLSGDEYPIGTFTVVGSIVNTPCFDFGDFRAQKRFGDYVVDYEAPSATYGVWSEPRYDNYTVSAPVIPILPPSSRTLSAPNDLAQKEARNISLILAWGEPIRVRIYGWQPSYIPQPIDMGTTPTDWDDGGDLSAKWLQGCIIEGDTGNTARTIQVQGDNGVVGATVTGQFNGQGVQAFSWPPFITHLMRLAPTDTGDTWKNYKVQWIWEPEPELTPYWVTQGTDHDLQGFMHVKEAQIAHISTVDIAFTITADARTINLTIPNSGGAYRKTYLILPANKAKIYSYSLISPPGFRLFKRDCEVRVKQWNSVGPYLPFNPFGGPHRADGARI